MSSQKLPWVVAGAGLLALGIVLVAQRRGSTSPISTTSTVHPDPRPGITAERVLPSSMMPNGPGVLAAYEAARSAPQALDGVYCHCNCSKSIGHRSLLTCFETEHGAYCDICMGEAMLAAKMAGDGRSLTEIRQAIDAQFGS